MILIFLATALVLAPLAYYTLPRSNQRRRIASVGGIIVVAWLAETVAMVGIGRWSLNEFRAASEKDAAPILLPEYSDFRIERESGDVGLFVFSYQAPAGVRLEEIIPKVRDQLMARYPCYGVLQESSDALQVRCSDQSRRHFVAEEFRLLLDRPRRRVFVLWLNDVPKDRQIYEEFVRTLDEARRR